MLSLMNSNELNWLDINNCISIANTSVPIMIAIFLKSNSMLSILKFKEVVAKTKAVL